MVSPLKLIFEAINQARSQHELQLQVVPKIGEYFVAKRYSIIQPAITVEQIIVQVIDCLYVLTAKQGDVSSVM
ncbi:hypothetical protein H6G76_27560 [Nostoc sp. FACHB-152]|uniref:hypothetical protein n=1 Tax=unclassified Nostoc TaxID=2593658 RepID=UPI001683354A|nr:MULTISPECIES: hypothetical protein [unclassified Nostoc]MBD2450817.1 hypothetical protein [Nostoc sp. FACHB-152]MBD2471965.1 hypothetical protein [Nostoc sp. FACHB-145]